MSQNDTREKMIRRMRLDVRYDGIARLAAALGPYLRCDWPGLEIVVVVVVHPIRLFERSNDPAVRRSRFVQTCFVSPSFREMQDAARYRRGSYALFRSVIEKGAVYRRLFTSGGAMEKITKREGSVCL